MKFIVNKGESMAENKEEIFKKITLDPSTLTDLKRLDNMFPELEKQVTALKRLGVNTSEIQDKIAWAKSVSQTMKEVFTEK